MIKLHTNFDRTPFYKLNNNPTPLYNYYKSMFNEFVNKYFGKLNQNINLTNDDFEFQFLPRIKKSQTNEPYTISFKTLLTGAYEEVMAVDGINLYMDICRLKYSCTYLRSSINDFLQRLFRSFPGIISYKENVEEEYHFKYTIKGVSINDVVKIKYNKKHSVSNKKAILKLVCNILACYPELYDEYNIANIKDLKQFAVSINDIYNEMNSLLETNIIKNGKRLRFINYDDFDSDVRNNMLFSLGIKVCPYCNRQYITSWEAGKITADLDHYYQKSLFPLFALSSFNFVPSCHVCNSLMKGRKYAETLYPYDDSADGHIKFIINLKQGREYKDIVDIWLGKGENSFPDIKKISELNIVNICNDSTRKKLIDNELELFRIEELYKTHLDEAINVLLVLRIYIEEDFYKDNINAICDRIGMRQGEHCKISKEEIRGFLLGFVTDRQEEMDKPLAKLISDIYNQEANNIIN